MSKVYFHVEVVEGITRVQAGPFGEHLARDAAVCISRAVAALGNTESGGLGEVLFDCPSSRIQDLEGRLNGLKVHVGSEVGGAVFRALGFGSRRVQILEVPLNRLGQVLELCWEHAPLLFGIPAHASHVGSEPPDLTKTVTPSVQYLQQWRSFGAVFYHGEWVAFSAGHVSQEGLLQTIVACFKEDGWECVISPEPM